MAQYLVLILGPGRKVLQVRPMVAKDRFEADSRAPRVALADPDCYGYELWADGAKLGGFFSPTPIASLSAAALRLN